MATAYPPYFLSLNMDITKFEINKTKTAIDLHVENISNLLAVFIFTNDNYKDYSEALNITDRFTGTSEEVEVSLSDLSINQFDGLYFVEIITDDNKYYSQTVLESLKYDECILDKMLSGRNCDSCLDNVPKSTYNAFNLVRALEIASREGMIEEAFNIIKTLDKYCSNECRSCGPYGNVRSNTYFNRQ